MILLLLTIFGGQYFLTLSSPFSVSALMHATIFGNVTALVARLYGARKSLYQTKWKDLKDFTILHSVPKNLKMRMQDYFQTMWSLNHGIDPTEVSRYYAKYRMNVIGVFSIDFGGLPGGITRGCVLTFASRSSQFTPF